MTYYLDYAATTPLDPRVFDVMTPYLKDLYANPSSLHDAGITIRKKINEARECVASWFNVLPSGVIFTSGGTEATNLAIMGFAKAHPEKKHIITSAIEHHATLHTVEAMSKMGYEVDVISVDHEGFIHLEQLKKMIRKDTLMVSIIWGNNEIGTIQDVQTIGHLVHEKGVAFHVDAVQMASQTCINMALLPVDMMTISAHKFYGPKGVGALILKEGITLEPMIYGGNHEKGLRSGTENVSGIIGLAKALEVSRASMESYLHELDLIHQAYRNQLQRMIPSAKFNGPKDHQHRLASILSLSLPNVSSHELQFALNRKGIFVSTGSACLSNDMVSSHVLGAIDRDPTFGTIRLSFGTHTKVEDVSHVVEKIKEVYDNIKEN